MSESIFGRMRRVVSATVEDTVDRIELVNDEGVMREAIREVDRAIDQVRAEQETAMARRLQAVRQQKLLSERVAQLNEKAKFALDSGREDLAEAALSRQIDFEKQAEALSEVQTTAATEEARLDDSLAALKTRKQQMQEALDAFTVARREASLGGDGPSRNEQSVEKNVERAEQAFDRAMAGAGGVGFTRADADTINRVAEIDTMQKSAEVAARLAALKGGKTKAA